MLPSNGSHRRVRTPWSRILALAMMLVVGWSSVEVLWADEPAGAAALPGAAADESASEEDCPCFCACACQAVHVVVARPLEGAVERVTPAIEPAPRTVAPQTASGDPPHRPPRPHV